MPDREWCYARGGSRHGPVTAAEMRRRVAAAEVGPADPVWPVERPEATAPAAAWTEFLHVPASPSPATPTRPPAPVWLRVVGGVVEAVGSCVGLLVTVGGGLLVLAVVSRLACGPVPPPPPPPKPTPRVPVAVGFRPSAVGQGMVLRVRNTADQPLDDLMVTVTAVGGERAGQVVWRVPRPLPAGDEVEVGWAELGGWRLAAGETVRVWLVRPGYDPVVVTVPVKAAL